jgi:hypothetical protein
MMTNSTDVLSILPAIKNGKRTVVEAEVMKRKADATMAVFEEAHR